MLGCFQTVNGFGKKSQPTNSKPVMKKKGEKENPIDPCASTVNFSKKLDEDEREQISETKEQDGFCEKLNNSDKVEPETAVTFNL